MQIRYARREIRLYARDAVLRKEQCAEAGLERKVAELRDVVVGEIDCIVVLLLRIRACRDTILVVGNAVGRTRAAPMFSMAEILWPRVYRH